MPVVLRLGILFVPGSIICSALEVGVAGAAEWGLPDANDILGVLQKSRTAQPCDMEQQAADGFAAPVNGLTKLMGPSSRVFLIGDGLVGELCERGSPGFCCSDVKPCVGVPTFRSQGYGWKLSMERHGWSALQKFPLRARDHSAATSFAYYLRPDAPSNVNEVQGVVSKVSELLSGVGANSKDVMIVGPLGTQAGGSLPILSNYTHELLNSVVNPFPGRVVLLGFSPEHPATAAGGDCAASPLPGEEDPPRNGFQSAIFVYTIWRHLTNMRARLVDVSQMLHELPSCHRRTLLATCTEWKDPVVSVISQLVLNALEAIK